MKPFKVMFGSKESTIAFPYLVLAQNIKSAVKRIEDAKSMEYEGGGEVKAIEELGLEIIQ